MPSNHCVRVGSGTARYRIERLEQIMQQKEAEVAKLLQVRQVLAEREKVVSQCVAQQEDMLYHMGCMKFTLPDTSDEEQHKQRATAAMDALLKDIEAAQLMQLADSYSLSCSAALSACSGRSRFTALEEEEEQEQQQEEQQQPPPPPGQGRQEQYSNRILRSFLDRPDCVQTLRQIQDASLEKLAELCKAKTMEIGFAIARYPGTSYMDADSIEDPQVQAKQEAANRRLQAAVDAYFTMVHLLHLTQEKVLHLSLLDLEAMQPETPSAGFWQEVAAKLQLGSDQAQEIHLAFNWYDHKRTEYTTQIQRTMQQLQAMFDKAGQLVPPVHLAAADAVSGAGTKEDAVLQPSSSDSGASSSSAIHTRSGSGAGNGGCSCSSSEMVFGTLEEADKVLRELGKQVWQLREVSRCLVFQFMNVLDAYQHSMVILHSWPFLAQPPPIIAAIVKQRVQEQQVKEWHEAQQELQQSKRSNNSSIGKGTSSGR